MADEINTDDKPLEEGYTEFGGTANRSGSLFNPTGPIGKFFAKFFASKICYITSSCSPNINMLFSSRDWNFTLPVKYLRSYNSSLIFIIVYFLPKAKQC